MGFFRQQGFFFLPSMGAIVGQSLSFFVTGVLDKSWTLGVILVS